MKKKTAVSRVKVGSQAKVRSFKSVFSIGVLFATFSASVAHAIFPILVAIPVFLVAGIVSENRIDEVHARRAYFADCVFRHEAVVREFLPESRDEFLKEPRELSDQKKSTPYAQRLAYFDRLSDRLSQFHAYSDLKAAQECFSWLSGDDVTGRESKKNRKPVEKIVDRNFNDFRYANPVVGFTDSQGSYKSVYRTYETLMGMKETLDQARDQILDMHASIQPKVAEYAKYIKANEDFAISVLGSREHAHEVVERFFEHRKKVDELRRKFQPLHGSARKAVLEELYALNDEYKTLVRGEDGVLVKSLNSEQKKHVKELGLLSVHYMTKHYSSDPALLKAVSLLGPWDRIKELTKKLSLVEQLAFAVILAEEIQL